MRGSSSTSIILILFAVSLLHSASALYIHQPYQLQSPHPRGRSLDDCVTKVASIESSSKLIIDIDGQRQQFAMSHLRSLKDVHAMSNYFVSSYYVDHYDKNAKKKLSKELYSRSQASILPPTSWQDYKQELKCVVHRDQKPKNKKISLIYQMNFSDPLNHREWLKEILHDEMDDTMQYEEIWDGHFRYFSDYAIIVYHTESCEKEKTPLLSYLKEYDRLHYAYGVIHLHDERINGCRSHYPMARFVLRNNMHPSMYSRTNVLEIPIGYSNGAGRSTSRPGMMKPPIERDLVWSFSGDTRSKPHRQNTIKKMFEFYSNNDHLHHHQTNIWNDRSKLNISTYVNFMKRSIFVPSPIGTVYEDGNKPNGLGAIRTWEALEQGALPIIESFEFFDPKWREHTDWLYLGRYNILNESLFPIPLLIVNQNWSNVKDILHPFVNDLDRLNALWSHTMEWYDKIKMNTRKFVRHFVLDQLYESRQWKTAEEFGHCTILSKNIYYTMKCIAEEVPTNA